VEGIYWFRMSAVFALFLGSIWVLLPTALRGSAEERLTQAAAGVEGPGQQGAQTELELPVQEGSAPELVPVLQRRLEVANLQVDRVEAVGQAVQIKLGAGTSKEAVAELARAKGTVSVHAVELVTQLPPKGAPPAVPDAPAPWDEPLKAAAAADAAYWSQVIPTLQGVAVPPQTVAWPLTVAKAEPAPAGARLSWTDPAATFPPGAPFGVVAVDGTVAGVVFADGALYELAPSPAARAALISGPLPGSLGDPVQKGTPQVTDAGQGTEPAVEESNVPGWLQGILPDTAIVLGLDLQGGIDLTLQVGLEEAVLGQVARDAVSLKEAAARDGVAIESLRRSHTRPVLEITTAAPLADVQTFLRKYAREYVYMDSEGNEHRFELSDTQREAVEDQAVEQVLDTLRKRVNATGVKGGSITRKSGGRINVQMPGMNDMEAAVATIGTTAVLEFRMVDDEFDDAYLEKILVAAKDGMPPDQFADDRLVNVWLWEQKRLDEDRIIVWEYEPAPQGSPPGTPDSRLRAYPLKIETVLTGNDINDAGVGWDQNQQPYVTLDFKPRGGQIFCDVTGQNVGKQFAVILDDRVQSAPSIRERICGGAARIEMGGSEDPTKDAQTLALVLRTGALDAPVIIASSRYVGPSLGADSIREGTIAAVVGSVLVYLFMILWYRVAGFIADVALTINVLMLLAVLALFGAELTLTGIAGLALTVGMAVDSNIIIYERIREELKLGVHPRKAVDIGFEKALVAVVDANITTAIAGIVLYSYGDQTVKGFAVTLLIGIVTTLITAVFVTRTIMDAMTRSSATRLQI
jgi:preprotein translocase subunit SecD